MSESGLVQLSDDGKELFDVPELRKGCRATKNEKKCNQYSYSLGRCVLGWVKATCSMCEQPKAGTKAARDAACVRAYFTEDEKFTYQITLNFHV